MFLFTPKAVTTTSPSCSASSLIETFRVDWFPAGTSLVVYPKEVNTRMALLPLTEMVKLPSKSVEVPLLVPFSTTFTPGNGTPDSDSVTVPEMVLFCPYMLFIQSTAKNINK